MINKTDLADPKPLFDFLKSRTKEEALLVSATTGEGMSRVKEALTRKVPENFGERFITGDLLSFCRVFVPDHNRCPCSVFVSAQCQQPPARGNRGSFPFCVLTPVYVLPHSVLRHRYHAVSDPDSMDFDSSGEYTDCFLYHCPLPKNLSEEQGDLICLFHPSGLGSSSSGNLLCRSDGKYVSAKKQTR